MEVLKSRKQALVDTRGKNALPALMPTNEEDDLVRSISVGVFDSKADLQAFLWAPTLYVFEIIRAFGYGSDNPRGVSSKFHYS